MKRLIIATLMASVCMLTQAQQSTISNFKAVGLLPQYDESFKPCIGVVAQMDLTYSRIAEDKGGCIVLMHNGRLPQINTAFDLIDAAQEYSVACEDLTAAAGQKTEKIELFLPMDERLNGTEQVVYLQAFVMYDDGNPKLLAKSKVLTVNPKDLTMLQQNIDSDEITGNIQRNMLGDLFKGMITNPDAVGDDGYKPCPVCKGNGELKDDSYDHAEGREPGKKHVITVSTCKECGGTGRVKATSGDLEMKRSMEGLLDGLGVSGGDLFDIFIGSPKKTTKSKQNTSKKRR